MIILSLLKEIFSESHNGIMKLSSGRIFSAILLSFYICVAIFIAIEKKEIVDIPLQLAGLIASLYGINKISGAISNRKNEK